ncbi:MAG: amidohydrolase [Planctomycetes bacterium]|nr:amidohydrolase [Planctomycetota bacterium]
MHRRPLHSPLRARLGLACLALALACACAGTPVFTPRLVSHSSPHAAGAAPLAASPLAAAIDARLAASESKLIAWRRHLHQHPELSNREVETARFVADRLREMGLELRTGVARHGVVAVIRGGKPGPVVALRADMDALPVTEEVDLPFKSTAQGTYEGRTVGVMHACGHDAHTAMLLAAADALVSVRAELSGSVVLIFQPAEEGVPRDEHPAGAELMVKEGVLDDPRVDVVFGLHVFAGRPTGQVGWRSGPVLAAADKFEIQVIGHQTHGSKPWSGIDPIVVASEIVGALQTIVSRTVDLTNEPAVVTVGQFESGVRNNIIPDRARLVGTIRTFDAAMREDVHARVQRIAENVAAAHGARVEVKLEPGYPVTANDAALTERMLPTLERVAPGDVVEVRKITGAEDFAYYASRVPGLFLFLGVTPPDRVATADSNHSPRFYVDESALPTGARLLAHLAADYLAGDTSLP